MLGMMVIGAFFPLFLRFSYENAGNAPFFVRFTNKCKEKTAQVPLSSTPAQRRLRMIICTSAYPLRAIDLSSKSSQFAPVFGPIHQISVCLPGVGLLDALHCDVLCGPLFPSFSAIFNRKNALFPAFP